MCFFVLLRSFRFVLFCFVFMQLRDLPVKSTAVSKRRCCCGCCSSSSTTFWCSLQRPHAPLGYHAKNLARSFSSAKSLGYKHGRLNFVIYGPTGLAKRKSFHNLMLISICLTSHSGGRVEGEGARQQEWQLSSRWRWQYVCR